MTPQAQKLIALAASCLIMVGCAQTGPPLPPSLELPRPPNDLRAVRKGNRITLTWSQPTLTTDREAVRYIGPTLVCRSLESEITACTDQVAILPAPSAPAPKPAQQRPAPLSYTDVLPSTMQQQDATGEVTYAVEVLNRNARGSGVSNRVHLSTVATVAPPGDLSTELTDDGVVLNWGGVAEAPESTGVRHRYRIYRREDGSDKDAVAGEVPFGDAGPMHFTDSSFVWEKAYFYRVAAVSIVRRSDSAVQIEGDDSPSVRVVAHDIFPPAVPAGLQAAFSGEGQKPFIDLVWAPVTSADLAGYNVYRAEADGSATKLNSELVKLPAYRDSAIASGKTYTYSVSAVDVRGNESKRSESATESMP